MTQIVAGAGPCYPHKIALFIIGVIIFVDIHHRISPEIDGVGAGGKAAVVLFGVHHLHSQGLPATGRAAINETAPALAQAAKLLLNIGYQFVGNGIAIGAQIGRINGIGAIVIGIGVLHFYDNDPRKIGGGPFLVKIIGFLLLNTVVAGQPEALAVVGLQVFIGRLGTEAAKGVGEMAVEDNQRIVCFGMLVKALRQQYMGTQIHIAPPEVAQQLAFHFHMADVFGVFWWWYRWYLAFQHQVYLLAGRKVYLLWSAQQITG